MKSLFRNLTVFLVHVFLNSILVSFQNRCWKKNKRYEIRLTAPPPSPPFVKKFHKIMFVFLGDGFLYHSHHRQGLREAAL